MMARDDISRNEAQGRIHGMHCSRMFSLSMFDIDFAAFAVVGNMDAYIRNPNDWALQKVEEQRGAPKFEYANANMNVGDLILTAGWSSILLAFISRTVYDYTVGCDSFCQEYHF